jgi:hypothetical protein
MRLPVPARTRWGSGKRAPPLKPRSLASVSDYVAKAVLERFPSARERYRQCLPVAERFAGVRRLFQNPVSHRQSQT